MQQRINQCLTNVCTVQSSRNQCLTWITIIVLGIAYLFQSIAFNAINTRTNTSNVAFICDKPAINTDFSCKTNDAQISYITNDCFSRYCKVMLLDSYEFATQMTYFIYYIIHFIFDLALIASICMLYTKIQSQNQNVDDYSRL